MTQNDKTTIEKYCPECEAVTERTHGTSCDECGHFVYTEDGGGTDHPGFVTALLLLAVPVVIYDRLIKPLVGWLKRRIE